MISYAGQQLIDDDPELLARVRAVLSEHDLRDFARPNWPGRTAAFGFPWQERETAPTINRLVWPTGASRPAMGWFLTDDAGLSVIRPAAYGGQTLGSGGSGAGGQLIPQPFVMSDGTSITAQLYMLPPRPLGQCGAGSDLYLITLTDYRFFIPDTAATISFTPGSTTWAQLFGIILDPSVSVAVDSVPSAYLMPTPDWVLSGYEDPAKLMDAAAAAVGMRVVFALDGTVRVLGPASGASLFAANLVASAAAGVNLGLPNITAGGFFNFTTNTQSDLAGILPPGIGFIDGAGSNAQFVSLSSLALPQFSGALLGPSATAPTLRTLQTGSSAQMTALANQMAKDWYSWRACSIDAAFSGVNPWIPTGGEDRIEWTHHGHEISTRVQRAPWNVRTEWAAPDKDDWFIELTGNPGSSCGYLEAQLMLKTTTPAGCVKYVAGPIVQALDLNATSGSG